MTVRYTTDYYTSGTFFERGTYSFRMCRENKQRADIFFIFVFGVEGEDNNRGAVV